MHVNGVYLVFHIFGFVILRSDSTKLPIKDAVVTSGGLVIKDKQKTEEVSEKLNVFSKISDSFEKNYRSVGGVSDFSKVVVGMMDSLKDLETKGDEMVKKISMQESRLKSVNQEISAKEEYVNVVNQKVKESENIFNDLQSRIKDVEDQKRMAVEDTSKNRNKIKAQEVRLQRLLKDITTKVSYVNVVDSKIDEMETKIDGVTRTLDLLEEEKGKLENSVEGLERRHGATKQQLQHINKEINEKEKRQRVEKDEYKKEVEIYNDSLSRMKEDLLEYETNIEVANNTLSDLEKTAKEILPVESKIVSNEILYPAFALSLLFNVVIGGKMLSEVPAKLQDLSSDILTEDQDVEEAIHYGPSTYDYNEDYASRRDDTPDIDPILQLAQIKREKENTFGKKSDFDYLRRSDFQDLAYSYK